MKKVALHNLGCKVNAYEMDNMQQMLEKQGYEIVPFDEMADIYIVNTCTVTNIADRKSRQMLHQARKRNPKAVIVAVGCYVQTKGSEDVLSDGVDLAIGNNKKSELVPTLEAYLSGREKEEAHQGRGLVMANVCDINAPCDYEDMHLEKTGEHCRANIKIQDGCNQFCSYCVIPYARGRVRSRSFDEIKSEIEGLIDRGYKEFVLTGIHISSYGIDFDKEEWIAGNCVAKKRENGIRDYGGESKLIDLLEKIAKIEGVERIRLGSLEPRIVTEEHVKRMAGITKLCPHFHLSLQSGCDTVLNRMNRHYTTGEYLQGVKLLRTYFEHPAITTDVIVGFPGETDEEFAVTETFLDEAKLYEMHIFKYSKRKGTPAATMPAQVDSVVQKHRSESLLALNEKISEEFRAYYVGKKVQVLFEEQKCIHNEIYQIGHTREYVKVALKTKEDLANHIMTGEIQGHLTEDIMLLG